MPSFLSKVFARKKDEEKSSRSGKRSSVASLLEGKFEAVSPTISPSATNFAESASRSKEKEKAKEHDKDVGKDTGFSLFRSRSRPVSPLPESPKSIPEVPRLTLNLPVPKEERSRALGVVFEADPDDRSTLPDALIGERRLSPLEALLLVKACSGAIVEHGGLETLGVMHPHWYSASPDVQRRLISLFILSLAPKSPITTLSPSPTSPSLIFNTELEYTRSPHDIAAVLRWALRHVRLEGESFGGTPDQWQWYRTFTDSERSSSYPPRAFSEILLPKLPPAHLQLLVATLEIVSSLAAHSERNGISGSKLSKFFGLWLLTTRRSEEGDDWASFYSRWERAGRILEHLFLAQIRDEMVQKQMPLRLSELVTAYPYSKAGSPTEDDGLLPHPRLSTRRYDTLYVRIESQLPDRNATKTKQHPLRLVIETLKVDTIGSVGEHYALWDAIKKAASSGDASDTSEGYPALTRIFEDETTRILSLVPAESSDEVPSSAGPSRLRSKSAPQTRANGKATSNGHNEVPPPLPTKATELTSPTDWVDFSTTGFGDSTLGMDFAKTLLDSDVEKTSPPSTTGRVSKKPKVSPEPSRRSSVDTPSPPRPARQSQSPKPLKSTLSAVNIVKLDEAFVDFWNDALLDPISADWPNVVVCQLKPVAGAELDGRPLAWLVLEQVFTHPPPPPAPEPQVTSPVTPRRGSTPGRRASLKSNGSARKSSTFTAAKRRFNLFSSPSQTFAAADAKARKKPSKSPRIGELGEILPEEAKPQTQSPPPLPASPAEQPKGLGLSGVAIEPAVAVAATAAATETAEAKPIELSPVPVVEAEAPPATAPAVVSEPIKTNEESAQDKPTVPLPHEPNVPSDAPPTPPEKDQQEELKTLPPAPESVVLTGETPGPQVALDTSEPAALAQASAQTQDETAGAVEEFTEPRGAAVPEAVVEAQAPAVEPSHQEEQLTQVLASGEPASVPEGPSLPTEDSVMSGAIAAESHEAAGVTEVAPSQPTLSHDEPTSTEADAPEPTAQSASLASAVPVQTSGPEPTYAATQEEVPEQEAEALSQEPEAAALAPSTSQTAPVDETPVTPVIPHETTHSAVLEASETAPITSVINEAASIEVAAPETTAEIASLPAPESAQPTNAAEHADGLSTEPAEPSVSVTEDIAQASSIPARQEQAADHPASND